MGTIKDRNGMDLTEADNIKKRWQEYTEELYKRDLHDPDNYNGVITHLEPDILEFKVKRGLGSPRTAFHLMIRSSSMSFRRLNSHLKNYYFASTFFGVILLLSLFAFY